jgi:hypothetical protein
MVPGESGLWRFGADDNVGPPPLAGRLSVAGRLTERLYRGFFKLLTVTEIFNVPINKTRMITQTNGSS